MSILRLKDKKKSSTGPVEATGGVEAPSKASDQGASESQAQREPSAHVSSAPSPLIELSHLSCEAIIGIEPHERVRAQALTLELSLALEEGGFWQSALSGELNSSINYVESRAVGLFLAKQGRFRLLESLVATLARLSLRRRTNTEPGARPLEVSVKASKPEVFGDGSTPSVRLTLTQASYERLAQARGWERALSPAELKRLQLSASLQSVEVEHLVSLQELKLVLIRAQEGASLKLSPRDALLPLTEGWSLKSDQGSEPLSAFTSYDPAELLKARRRASLKVSAEAGAVGVLLERL